MKSISSNYSHGNLKISQNGRFIAYEDGKPFFYLGDTAWQLFHVLKLEEVEYYLEDRRDKGYTIVQAVVLTEFDGLNTTNAYGDKPLFDNNPEKPNEKYFEHIDRIVDMAYQKGIYIGMLPTWGDKVDLWKWGVGPVIFNSSNAREYGRFLGSRYKDKPNIIWILGGDRSPAGFEDIWRNMAAGLASGDGGKHLKTYHPLGWQSSSIFFHNEDWMNFNMLQSGHCARDFHNYKFIDDDYGLTPPKPCIDGEPRYEDHPVDWKTENGYFDGFDARQAAYWAVFAGAFGHTYGCQDIWQFYDPERGNITQARTCWRDALNLPGAWGMFHLRNLIESRPFFTRIPDQSVVAGECGEGMDHIRATRDSKGSYAFVYIPTGKQVKINMNTISGEAVKAYWFNPREGTAVEIGFFTNNGEIEFNPPTKGRDNDWVLVLDDQAKGYPFPGCRKEDTND